jgi:hypothetical protein
LYLVDFVCFIHRELFLTYISALLGLLFGQANFHGQFEKERGQFGGSFSPSAWHICLSFSESAISKQVGYVS